MRPQEIFIELQPFRLLLVVEVLLFSFWITSKKRFDSPLYLDMLWLGIAIFLSYLLVSVSLGFDALLNYIIYSYIIFLCVSNGLTTYTRAKKLLFFILISTSFMCIDGLSQALDANHIGITGMQSFRRADGPSVVYQIRYLGFLNDPNDMGMMLVFSLPVICFFYFDCSNKLLRLFYLSIFVLHIVALYLTNSRGTMLSGVVVLGAFLQLKYGGLRSLIFGGALLALIISFAPSRMGGGVDESSMDRIYAWYEGFQMFKWRPVFGIGQGRFLEYHPKTAHNSWVLALAEIGMFGYYFWFSLTSSTLLYQYKMYQFLLALKDADKFSALGEAVQTSLNKERLMAHALMLSTLGILTAAFFLSRTYMVLIFINAGLAVSQYQRLKDQNIGFQFSIGRIKMFFFALVSIVVINVFIRLMSP
ncbi:MAG: O-antigen ligase family protein [Pseudomonadales bacterium]|nr:O-antigen ligase family protein [Pseudomonadales bacterium]